MADSDWSNLEAWLSACMRDRKIPGAALGVIQAGEIVYQRGFGVTSVEEGGVPVSPGSLFAIGSVTKLFTRTAVMRLAEEGRLDLEVPVSRYLPGFPGEGAWPGVTLRWLLSHTSGLPSEYIDEASYQNGIKLGRTCCHIKGYEGSCLGHLRAVWTAPCYITHHYAAVHCLTDYLTSCLDTSSILIPRIFWLNLTQVAPYKQLML
jgi:Beta-lactamase